MALAFQAPVQAQTACTYKVLGIVAHQDDDIWFMSQDLQSHVDQGACVQMVYTTNGRPADDSHLYALNRINGALAAWSHMAHAPALPPAGWSRSVLTLGAHRPVQYQHANGKLSKVFLSIDDPWMGAGWGSLTPIAQVDRQPTASVYAFPDLRHDRNDVALVNKDANASRESYDRADVVASLSQLVTRFAPSIVYVQDPLPGARYEDMGWGKGEGFDHPSHIATARLALEAVRAAAPHVPVRAMVDYAIQGRLRNGTDVQQEAHHMLMDAYGPWDWRAGIQCPPQAAPDKGDCVIGGLEAAWLGKQYRADLTGDAPAVLVTAAAMSGFGSNAVVLASVGQPKNNTRGGSYRDDALVVGEAGRAPSTVLSGYRFAGTPALVAGGDHRVSVFARTLDGQVVYLPSKAGGDWWKELLWKDRAITSDPVAVRMRDGRLIVFAVEASGRLVYRQEEQVGNAWAPAWQNTDATGLVPEQSLAAAVHADGRLVVAARGTDGTVQLSSQSTEGSRRFTVQRSSVGQGAAEVGLVVADRQLTMTWLDARTREVQVSNVLATSADGSLTWTAPRVVVNASARIERHRTVLRAGQVTVVGTCKAHDDVVCSQGTAVGATLDRSGLKGPAGAAAHGSALQVAGRNAGGEAAAAIR